MPRSKRTLVETQGDDQPVGRSAKRAQVDQQHDAQMSAMAPASKDGADTPANTPDGEASGEQSLDSITESDPDARLAQIEVELEQAKSERKEVGKTYRQIEAERRKKFREAEERWLEKRKKYQQAAEKIETEYEGWDTEYKACEKKIKELEKEKRALLKRKATVTAPSDNLQAAQALEYVTIPQPEYSLPSDSDSSDEEMDSDEEIDSDEAVEPADHETESSDKQVKEKSKEVSQNPVNMDGHPAEQFPNHPWIMSRPVKKLVRKYFLQAMKRDPDQFGMYVYNDYAGYGLQEVIENQLVAINTLMNRKPLPPAVDLWVQLSALAHWFSVVDLAPWMMIDDGERWKDTAAMIGIAIITVLNALERAELLGQDSPLKDLPFVLALLGRLSLELVSMVGVPYISHQKEASWPYKIVQYIKKHGIQLEGVNRIEEKFVQKYNDEKEANVWKKKEAKDRWGWSTKWKHMTDNYGQEVLLGMGGGSKLGGDAFDITKETPGWRKKHAFDKKDPLKDLNIPDEDAE